VGDVPHSTRNTNPHTQHPKPSTAQPRTLNTQHSTLNTQHSALNTHPRPRFALAHLTGAIERLDQWEMFAVISAALCHDLEHPGELLRRNVNRFRGGLVFKAHRLVYHSTLGLRVIKKKKKFSAKGGRGALPRPRAPRCVRREDFFFSSLLLSSLELNDTKVYEP